MATQKTHILVRGVRKTEGIFKVVSMVMLFLLMLIGTIDVLARYLFNNPFVGTTELGTVLLLGIVVLSWAATQAVKGHVTVDFIPRFPPRAQAITDFLMLLLELILFALIAWQAVVSGMTSWTQNRDVPIIHIPFVILHFTVSLAACLMCLTLVVQMFNLIPVIKKGG